MIIGQKPGKKQKTSKILCTEGIIGKRMVKQWKMSKIIYSKGDLSFKIEMPDAGCHQPIRHFVCLHHIMVYFQISEF